MTADIADLWVPERARSAKNQYRKKTAPITGNAFGAWAGRENLNNLQLPGGAVLQFDLNRLTLADYRGMRTHYQVNISLAALVFLLHQLDWRISCDNKAIAAAAEESLRPKWTQLIRGMSQAYWSGYSPMVIDWENNPTSGRIEFDNFKDLTPEECRVHWKVVEGYAEADNVQPQFVEYDGIDQGAWIGAGFLGSSFLDGRMRRNINAGGTASVPAQNSLWYPLLMENGDYYGRKLLKAAFPAWFFSQLIHLYQNRYLERFGEPVPIGRAPFGEELNMDDGTVVTGRAAMEAILSGIRNRSVIVLPNDLQPQKQGSSHSKPVFEYEVEYLESQMRGADFERYLTRLDEEISLALFTPLLMTRVADVGSYNLGVGHTQMYLWMFNALVKDFQQYINDFALDRFVDFNYGPNAPRARWEFSQGGKHDTETLRAIITALITGQLAEVDLGELGIALGLTVTEIKQVTAPPTEPADPNAPKPAKKDPRAGRVKDAPKSSGPRGVGKTRATAKSIHERVAAQAHKNFREGRFAEGFEPELGYRRQFEEALQEDGVPDAATATGEFYNRMGAWIGDVLPLEYSAPEEFLNLFATVIEAEVEDLADTGS